MRVTVREHPRQRVSVQRFNAQVAERVFLQRVDATAQRVHLLGVRRNNLLKVPEAQHVERTVGLAQNLTKLLQINTEATAHCTYGV